MPHLHNLYFLVKQILLFYCVLFIKLSSFSYRDSFFNKKLNFVLFLDQYLQGVYICCHEVSKLTNEHIFFGGGGCREEFVGREWDILRVGPLRADP